MKSHQYYRDQKQWRELQKYLPERLRLDDSSAPEEDFWEWRGNTIHLDRYRNPNAPARVVLHHGVGTNGRQLSLIVGAPLAQRGYDGAALDNLGYGLTSVAQGFQYTYDDWVQLVVDFLAAEGARDKRPVVLYGLSAGGMMTYHVAAAAPRGTIRGIVGMTFLDARNQQVRDEAMHDIVTSRIGAPLVNLLARTPLAALRYPMTMAVKMSALANDPGAMKAFLADKTSAANAMTMRFLSSYMKYSPAVEPGQFEACPILLTQPAKDRWTPRHLSTPVLSAIKKVAVEEVSLENAGHYPMEDPGLQQMVDAIDDFIKRVIV